MSIFLKLLNPENALCLLLAILAASLVYFLVLFLLKGLSIHEKKFLRNLFNL